MIGASVGWVWICNGNGKGVGGRWEGVGRALGGCWEAVGEVRVGAE